MITDAGFRRFAHAQAQLKAVQGGAPVFMYQWNWVTPAFEGRFGAAHGADVSATFGNVRDAIVGSGAPSGRRLCDRLSAAWVAFAKTGDPNVAGLPTWPAFHPDQRATMIFNDEIAVARDPDADVRAFWSRMPPATSVFG